MEAGDRLIVALDVVPDRLRELIEKLVPVVRWFKIGSRLIAPGLGIEAASLVRQLSPRARIFYDLKLHETPDTTEITIEALAEHNLDFTSVHAQAGVGAMRRAVEKAGNNRILAVTTLTSDRGDLTEETRRLALDAKEAGVAGIICPPNQVSALRLMKSLDGLVIICPGIRPSGSLLDNHRQSATPENATRLGADYLVVGRPITAAPNPREAAERIITEIAATLATK